MDLSHHPFLLRRKCIRICFSACLDLLSVPQFSRECSLCHEIQGRVFLGPEVHDYVPLGYSWVFINASIDFQPVCSCEVSRPSFLDFADVFGGTFNFRHLWLSTERLGFISRFSSQLRFFRHTFRELRVVCIENHSQCNIFFEIGLNTLLATS